MSAIFNFMVENEDVSVRFACACHARRIGEFVRNLRLDLRIPEDSVRKICRFTAGGSPLLFRFDDECIEGRDVRHEAVFFENTEYLVVVRGRAVAQCRIVDKRPEEERRRSGRHVGLCRWRTFRLSQFS